MTTPVSAMKAIRAALTAGIRRALSAAVWCVLLGLGGAGLLISGAYILAGSGWAFVVAGLLSMLMAALILMGMSRG